MDFTRKIGIQMTVDASSVATTLPQATRDFTRFADSADSAGLRASRGIDRVTVSMRDLVSGAAGLTIISSAVRGITDALTALPTKGFNFTRDLEVSQLGMAGILGSMTAINGQQTSFHQGLSISSDMVRKLNDDALRTAATSQELVSVFQALLAPGLSAGMSLEQVRQLTVVGTNAVKSIGLSGNQVVQELRDLVAGGITPASSMLATQLGLKDADIAKAKASSEGLFAFLMGKMTGFRASSDAFGQTLKGSFDQLQEGATRVAADGMKPLTDAIKVAVGDATKLFTAVDSAGNVQLNPGLVNGVHDYAESAASALRITTDMVSGLWAHRDAITSLAGAYAAFKLGQWGSQAVVAAQAQVQLAQASRLANVQAAAQATSNTEVTLTSRQKVTAYISELQARQATAQADVAANQAQLAQLATTEQAIQLSRAETVSKMESVRMTIAQAEAQIQAARAAGAQSFALANLRSGTITLTAAQARYAALMTELAALGQQQARVQASVAAATLASTAAVNVATSATAGLTAATGAASLSAGAATAAARGFGVAVGALGGPIGIIIIAVTSLVARLYELKTAAQDAARNEEQIKRAEQVAAAGGRPEERDFSSLPPTIEALKKQRDDLLVAARKKPTYRPASDTISADPFGFAPRTPDLATVNAQIAEEEKRLDNLTKASQRTQVANEDMTLTLAGTEQAWRLANEGIKTATSVQEDYDKKLGASRSTFTAYKAMLEKNNAGPNVVSKARARQAEDEAALAKERDRNLKALNPDAAAGVARATKDGLAARIEAVRDGYKTMAKETADGIDAIDSLRQLDLVSEYGAVQRRRDLQLQDLKNREDAVNRELALVRTRKDSLKDQQKLEGDLREITQQRTSVSNKADRDGQVVLVKPQIALVDSVRQGTNSIYEQSAALEAQNAAHNKAKTALQDLTIAQLEKSRADLESTDNVIPGYIDALDKRIAAERRLRSATGEAEGLELADGVRKKQLEDARKTSEDVRSLFRQGVVDAMEGGDGALASIGKSIKSTIVTSIADAFYDATIKNAVDSFSHWMSSTIQGALSGNSGASYGASLLKGLGGLSGGLSGAAAASAANSLGGSDTLGTMIGLMGLASAKGNVFASPGLHSYTNTLVDKPTLFPFAKGGIGLMGEAGTEAIMPLRRTADGRLGVSADGAAAASSLVFSPSPTINVDARSDRAAVIADVNRMLQENNRAQMAQLKRLRVIPA